MQHSDPKLLGGQNSEFRVKAKSEQKIMGRLVKVKSWHKVFSALQFLSPYSKLLSCFPIFPLQP